MIDHSTDIVIAENLELRESGRLHGLLITEGRASADRRELFVLGSCQFPSTGVQIRAAHESEAGAVRAFPYRNGNEILVNLEPSREIRNAVDAGAKYMSVEFKSLRESTTESGIREIERALIVGAAVVRDPSYRQTKAEIRRAELIDNFTLYL